MNPGRLRHIRKVTEFIMSWQSVAPSHVFVAIDAVSASTHSSETQAANAVRVVTSVTTVPASAYLGVGISVGEIGEGIGALLVLAVNVTLMILTATITLYLQRRFVPEKLSSRLAGHIKSGS